MATLHDALIEMSRIAEQLGGVEAEEDEAASWVGGDLAKDIADAVGIKMEDLEDLIGSEGMAQVYEEIVRANVLTYADMAHTSKERFEVVIAAHANAAQHFFKIGTMIGILYSRLNTTELDDQVNS